jgi:hypothetical protein
MTGIDHATLVEHLSQLSEQNKLTPAEIGFSKNCVSGLAKWGSLTPRMAAYAASIIRRLKNADAPSVIHNVRTIFDAFEFAKNHLRRPTIYFRHAELGIVKFAYMRQGTCRTRYPNQIHVSGDCLHDEADRRAYFGRIDTEGKFVAGRDLTPAVLKFLNDFADDPVTISAQYGLNTGFCCYCDRELGAGKDKRGLSVGYGPVCAKHWGLPFPKKQPTARV